MLTRLLGRLQVSQGDFPKTPQVRILPGALEFPQVRGYFGACREGAHPSRISSSDVRWWIPRPKPVNIRFAAHVTALHPLTASQRL